MPQDEGDARATNTSAETVSEIVDCKVGQPRPQADVPFRVEAYFLSLDLRSLLAKIAQSRVEGLSKTSNAPDTARHRTLWTSFVSFLYDSCVADAKKAAALAKGCPTPRHATRAAIYEVQFAFDVFRWKTMCERAELSRAGALGAAARERLQRKAADYKQDLARRSQQLQQSHLRAQPSQTMESLREERRWLEENCRAKVAVMERECSKLEAELVTPSAVHNRAIAQMRLEEDFTQRRPSGSTSGIAASRSGSSDQSSCVVA
uniref:Transcriptional repressor TUP1 n=1 Tax=Ganoderma boninense TaxID=34458 RepID=A0A5K1JZI6_9APHY|nr:Transcriptional repressor TUP1 [Ganoderma boninense]